MSLASSFRNISEGYEKFEPLRQVIQPAVQKSVQTLQECIAYAVQESAANLQALTKTVYDCVVKALHGQNLENVQEWVKVGVQDCFTERELFPNLQDCITKDAEQAVSFGQQCLASMQESASAMTSQLPASESLLEQLEAVTKNLTDSAINHVNEHPVVVGCILGAATVGVVTYSLHQWRKTHASTSNINASNNKHKKRRNTC